MCRISISLDDVKGIFRTLVNEELNSIFETRTLKFLKELHDKYGTSFELFCTYSHKDYCLANMTEKYKNEFKSNSDWLKFGFHCFEEDSAISDMCSTEFEMMFVDFIKHLNRVTGQDICLKQLRLHGFNGTKEICRILRKHGVVTLLASDDNRKNYYLNSKKNALLFEEGIYFDKEEDIRFVSSCVRLENNENIMNQISNKIDNKIDLIPIFTHEWQMDNETVRKRMEECCRIEQQMRESEFL